MLCAGFSLKPFVACFLFKVWNVRKRSLFFYLAWPLPPLESFSPRTGFVLTQCYIEIKFKRKLEFLEKKKPGIWNEICPKPDSLNLCNMSHPSLEVLWGIRCQSCTASVWGGSKTAVLGQMLPWDRNYPMGHFSYPSCSKRFTQLQYLISREVICGYNLDCPANCWMPEEAGGECATAGCVGFSFCFTLRTGGWEFKTP